MINRTKTPPFQASTAKVTLSAAAQATSKSLAGRITRCPIGAQVRSPMGAAPNACAAGPASDCTVTDAGGAPTCGITTPR